MKSIHLMGVAAFAFALMAPMSAQAEIPTGWYVGGNLNMVFQEDADSRLSGVTNSIEYKGGWGLSGNVGYGLGNGLRLEGEMLYRNSTVHDVTGTGSGPAGGGIHNKALMANAYYDFATGTRLTPYVGAGIGGSLVDADNIRTVNGAVLDNNDRLALAYQGIAGASIDLDGGWDFTIDYRYFATPDVTFKTNTAAKAKTENSSHNLMVGIRYAFARPAMAAPAPVATPVPMAPAPVAPPQAQAPVVAPVPQSYIVFFDFDRSSLTPEARRIVAAAAEDFKKGSYVRLVVTGHTDTMGTQQYNQRLSERRAAAVRTAFESMGVPGAEIVTAGEGKRNLMVPTADGVREAQNRRAEIVLQR